METLIAYIPIDRRKALFENNSLPDRTYGSALFADISGFTPLTEALIRELGPLRGAEELSKHLNSVYDALISQLYRYSGSVIGFSGDAITCWLDGDDGLRASACALGMQNAMERFASVSISPEKTVSLAMKATVATGDVRRFLVGDPKIQVIEVLAGTTLDNLAAAEHQANRGEVLLDETTFSSLNHQFSVKAWRQDEHTGRKFGVVDDLGIRVSPMPWPDLLESGLSYDTMRPWLLPAVYERLSSGQGEFLSEFRPAVSLFLRFGGIDYDNDQAAGTKLDNYIRQVQKVLFRYDASLIQLTMGDKGSYIQASFGAPIAHEDDALRAANAALELHKLKPVSEWAGEVQIGIAQGHMRTGSYGGTMRRTYGVLGDEVNLAARLMQAAAPGQIIVTEAIWDETRNSFTWDRLPPLRVKGRTDPFTVYSLLETFQRRSVRLQEPQYNLPMVGRAAELEAIKEKMGFTLQDHGQIIGIAGEAGMGKSRLLAEVIRSAYQMGFNALGGECQSYGTNTSYLVWHSVWQGLFELDPSWTLDQKVKSIERQLSLVDPNLVPRLPLLGPVLNLPIPDNELTRPLDAKLRKSSLDALLVDCFTHKADQTPLLIVLENFHWADPLSGDLLDSLGRAIHTLPVLFVLVFRPPEAVQSLDTNAFNLPNYSEITLKSFTQTESEQLVKLKLNQLLAADSEIPEKLVSHIVKRAEGNPFYIEELLNYLQDQGVDPHDPKALETLELPTSLHSLILTRLDQRSESQKITLKLASIIGRQFIAAWLWGAFPEMGDPSQVESDLEVLSQLDLSPVDTPEPELSYLFKHIVTQEVAYESLSYATRALLHDQLGQFIEQTFNNNPEQYVDLLAFHFERSRNQPKKREYLLKAGEAAQANYANTAAINYYQKVLPLLPPEEEVSVMLKIGQVHETLGNWEEARDLFHEALDLADKLGDRLAQARCQTAMGELFRKKGSYAEGLTWSEQAREGFESAGDRAGVGQVLHIQGSLAAQKGDYETAKSLYQQSLEIRRELDDKPNIASLLSNLGIVARFQGDYPRARSLHEQGLAIRRGLGDRWAIAVSLNNMGNVALDMGELEGARVYLEEAVKLQREVGAKYYIANALNNLGNVVRTQKEYKVARNLYTESLLLNRELRDGWQIAYLLEDIGCLENLLNNPTKAIRLVYAASALREKIGSPLSPTEKTRINSVLESAIKQVPQNEVDKAREAGLKMTIEQAIEEALKA
jgi:adenylate cyclase